MFVAAPPVCFHVIADAVVVIVVIVARGAREVFTSLRHFRDDLTTHPPDHFVCVPLVLDTLYNKVRGSKDGAWAGAPYCKSCCLSSFGNSSEGIGT